MNWLSLRMGPRWFVSAVLMMSLAAPFHDQRLAAGTPDDKSEMRTWTDETGKFKIEAKLVKTENGKVTLLRDTGKEVTLPIQKLSAADRKFLEHLAANAPAKADEEHQADKNAAANSSNDAAPAAPKFKLETNLHPDKAREVSIGPVAWKYIPDGVTHENASKARVVLGKRKSFFEKPAHVFLSPNTGSADVAMVQDSQGISTRVIRVDLTNEHLIGEFEYGNQLTPIAANADMTRVAVQPAQFLPGGKDVLTLFQMGKEQLEPRMAFSPAELKEPSAFADVKWAHFVAPDRLLTMTGMDRIVCWQIDDGIKALYQVKVASQTQLRPLVAVSPNHKYFAVSGEQGIAFIDAAAGANVGFIPKGEGEVYMAGMAFDPSGSQFAYCDTQAVHVFDLVLHKQTAEIYGFEQAHTGLFWLDRQYLLVNQRNVLDVANRVEVWRYHSIPLIDRIAGQTIWIEEDKKEIESLCLGSLPHAAARALTEGLSPEDLSCLKPGVTVSLDLRFESYAAQQEAVRADLVKQLEDLGVQVADGSKLVISLQVKPGPTKRIGFSNTGFGAVDAESRLLEQLDVPTHVALTQIKLGKQPIWGKKTEIGFRAKPNQGETIAQALPRCMEEDVLALGKFPLPRNLSVLPPGRVAGRSDTPIVD